MVNNSGLLVLLLVWSCQLGTLYGNPLDQYVSSSQYEKCSTDFTSTRIMNRCMAEKAIKAAISKSEELNVKMNIAVVDLGANLVSFTRMDDAWLGSVDIAMKKAKTAVMFNMNSGNIGTLSQPGGSLYNIEHSNNGLITFPGGIPVRNGAGQLVGAVGVSGSTVEDDHAVAEAAVQAIN